jgi:hypothetical protein
VKAIAAPAIQAEMNEWVALGGSNSGIVGAYDGSHPTGFHRAGFEVPTTDYSRRHDPGRPYDMAWCCAGDFSHDKQPALRARHAALLARLKSGDPALSMIVEFIGQPWPDKPVMYWARWDGVKTLKRYTGKGHDHWSHISWQRSRANERANLWTSTTAAQPIQTAAGGKKMLVIGKDTGSGQLYCCDGMSSRPISAGQLADIKWLAEHGAIGPLWNGGEIWAGWTPSFGDLAGAADALAIGDDQVERLAAALAGRPDNPLSDADVPTLVKAFKQAAREGAGS